MPRKKKLSYNQALKKVNHFNEKYSMIHQAEAVFDHVMKLKKGANILDIGICYGKISAMIMLACKERGANYYGVDDFSLIEEQEKVEVLKNLKAINKDATVYESDTREFEFDKPLDILIIDGGHYESAVKNDCDKFIHLVKKGGYAMFHDYTEEFEDPKHCHWAIKHYGDKHTDNDNWKDVAYVDNNLKIRQRTTKRKNVKRKR